MIFNSFINNPNTKTTNLQIALVWKKLQNVTLSYFAKPENWNEKKNRYVIGRKARSYTSAALINYTNPGREIAD